MADKHALQRQIADLESQLADCRAELARLVNKSAPVADSPPPLYSGNLMDYLSLFATLTTMLTDGLVVIDADQEIVFFNSGAEVILGYRADEVLGRPLDLFIPERFAKQHQFHIREFAASLSHTQRMGQYREIYALRKDGVEFPIEASIGKIAVDGHNLFAVILRDISDWRRATTRLKAQNEVMRVLAESATLKEAAPSLLGTICDNLGWEIGELWWKDPGEQALSFVAGWCNSQLAGEELVTTSQGLTFTAGAGLPGKILATNDPLWITDVTLSPDFHRQALALKIGLHGAFGFPIRLGTRTVGVILFLTTAIREPDADLLEMLTAIGQQIALFAERAQAELATRKSEETIRALLNAYAESVFLTDTDGTIVIANETFAERMGVPLEELPGKNAYELRPPDLAQSRWETINAVARTGQPANFVDERGGMILENKIYPIKDGTGRVVRLAAYSRNVTKEKQAEQALHKAERRYHNLFEQSPLSIVIVDPVTTAFLEFNEAACRQLGYTREEFGRLSIGDIEAVETPDETRSRVQQLFREGRAVFETEHRTKQGEIRNVIITAGVIELDGNKYIQSIFQDITDRKRAEQALQKTQEQSKAQYKGFPIPTYTYQRQGDDFALIDYNIATEILTQGGIVNFIGKPLKETIPDRPDLIANISRCFDERAAFSQEVTYTLHSTGETKNFISTYVFVPPDMVMVHTDDITLRKQAEVRLHENEARLSEAQRISHLGSWELNLQTNHLVWSDETCHIFEIDPQEFGASYEAFLAAIHPDDREAVNCAFTEAVENKTQYDISHRLLMADGRVKWVHERCETHYDDKGRPLRSIGTVQDVTERRRIEQQLRDERAFINAVLDNAGALVVVLDRDGRIRRFNRAAEKLSGYSFAELEGKFPWATILPPEDAETIRIQAFESLANNPERAVGNYENYWVSKTGERYLFEWINTLLLDVNGQVEFMVSIGIDITKRRRTEEALRKTEHRLQVVVDNSPIILFTIDNNGVFTLSEGKGLATLGLQAGQVVGLSVFDLYGQVPHVADNIRRALAGEQVSFIARNGSLAFDTHYIPYRNAEDKVVGLIGAAFDISSQIQATELAQAQLHEKETLLREIHHRVKNNLQVISSLLYLQSRKSGDETIQTMFRESHDRVVSMALVHEKLYQSADLARIPLGEYVADLAQSLFQVYGVEQTRVAVIIQAHEVTLDISHAVPCGLIINEIVSNSLKYAFPDQRRGVLRIELAVDSNGWYRLTLSDDGVGLPPDIEARARTSLGIRLIGRLVEQIHGSIERISANPGTTYHIVFPKVNDPSQ